MYFWKIMYFSGQGQKWQFWKSYVSFLALKYPPFNVNTVGWGALRGPILI